MAVGIVMEGILGGSAGRVQVMREALFSHYCSTHVRLDVTDLEIRGTKSEIINFLHANEGVRLRLGSGSDGSYIHCGKLAVNTTYRPMSIGTPLASVVKVPRAVASVVAAARSLYAGSGVGASGSEGLGETLERLGQLVGASSTRSRVADAFRAKRVVLVSQRSTGYDGEVHVPGNVLSLRGLKKLADVLL